MISRYMPGGDDSSLCGTLYPPFVGPGMRRKGVLGTMLLGVGLSQTGHVELNFFFPSKFIVENKFSTRKNRRSM